MKKHLIIAVVLFGVITALALASNFIRWDETALEQTIYALPLGIGLLLQMPFMSLMGLWIGNTTNYANYGLLWSIIPFITGAFYATLYFFIVFLVKKYIGRRPRNTIA